MCVYAIIVCCLASLKLDISSYLRRDIFYIATHDAWRSQWHPPSIHPLTPYLTPSFTNLSQPLPRRTSPPTYYPSSSFYSLPLQALFFTILSHALPHPRPSLTYLTPRSLLSPPPTFYPTSVRMAPIYEYVDCSLLALVNAHSDTCTQFIQLIHHVPHCDIGASQYCTSVQAVVFQSQKSPL